MVKGIVEQHSRRVEIESPLTILRIGEAGEGTTVVLWLAIQEDGKETRDEG